MKLGLENRKELIVAAVLGAVLLTLVVYEFMPGSSTNASTSPAAAIVAAETAARPGVVPRRGSVPVKKQAGAQNLDPMLNLDQLASAEKIKYEGTGRNIFVAQADTEIPTALGTGATDHKKKEEAPIWQPPPPPPAPPIPLKFFGFASHPGEPKKIFLVKGEDVFIAGEGEIVDRRYKVVKITTSSVDIQDLVNSGPPQSIPLTQG